ncbi:SDR family oxidoreductase [Paenibacillus sp. WLX2291]|uniref:SDR family oxidoreductase n=1 Tax=Paenibacillus sp. WLX2291 TaxID=3296934 RepID=UPI0039845C13
METNLYGKSVFVAAGSKGLGRASALEFAREGANVTIASRNVEHLQQAAAEIKEVTGRDVHYVLMDVSDGEQIQNAVNAAVQHYGRLDVLITNAGGPQAGSFADMDDAAWQRAFESNLLSTIRLIRSALPFLQEAGESRIVNIASSSVKQPIDGLILSNVYRAGIQALTKTLSSEYAAAGVLINTVAPGRIATERMQELDSRRAQTEGVAVEQVQAQSLHSIPLGRFGTPEEFGKMVMFYGSFANTYVTGQSLLVDGGTIRAF